MSSRFDTEIRALMQRLVRGEMPAMPADPALLHALIETLGEELRALEAERLRLGAVRERRRAANRELLRGLKAVRHLGDILLDTTDVDGICDRTVRVMVHDLGAENCSIMLIEPDRRTLRLRAAYGRGDDALTDDERANRFNRSRALMVGEGVAGHVAATGRARFLTNAADDPSFKAFQSAISVRSLYCFPLRGRGNVIGVVNMSHPNLDVSGTNLRRILNLLSESIGQVITIARLHRRMLTQEHERHAKLASMGEMAASVAHEINNPITNILLRAQKLQRTKASHEKVVSLCGDMEAEANRITKIIKKLLDVSRDEDEEPSFESLNDVVENTLILTEHHLRSKQSIKVKKHYAADLPVIRVVRRELEQVFTNLITNASRAMPEGGELTITTREGEAVADLPSGRYVAIDLADTGSGIPTDVMDRIFEPFFTTGKKIGGSGLGLPISQEIVERFGGRITVDSEPGEGATFTVTLPAE